MRIMHAIGVPGLLRARRVRGREVCVLMFHRVSDEPDPLWPPLPVAVFRKLMAALAADARVVPLESIGNEGTYPDKPLVALSFDDGYADFWHNAVPILAELDLPAQHNVCPGLVDRGELPWTQVVGWFMRLNPGREIRLPTGDAYRIGAEPTERDLLRLAGELMAVDDGQRGEWVAELAVELPADAVPRLMDWQEIRDCVAAGIQIGSHGMEHRNLAAVGDAALLAREIADSKERIAAATGRSPSVFSFPNGQYSAESMAAVRAAGYDTVLLCEDQATVLPPPSGSTRVFPRVNISRSDWREEHLRFLGLHQLVRGKLGGPHHLWDADQLVGHSN